MQIEQIDWLVYRQTDRQIDRCVDRQIDRWIDTADKLMGVNVLVYLAS